MKDCCIFTIISKNYISYARVLIKSFLSYHPEVKTFVLLADKVDGYFDPSKEPFELVEVDRLGIEDFNSFSFKYNIIEFNTAVKPFFFDYLFSKYGFQKIIYLDPDILVFRELTEIFEALDKYSVVLTPHIMKPIPDDGFSPKDIDILKGGIFNLGFIALSKTEHTEMLLTWWKERVYDKCLQGTLSGYAVDQKWISIVPCFFDDYYILRKPGYNVAYWNFHERSITKKDDEILINETPLYFFHFSGFDPNNIDKIAKYQNRFRLRDILELKELFELYKTLLIENGYRESLRWHYSYGFFKNGSRIPEIARSIYWGLGVGSKEFGDPFIHFWRKLFKAKHLRVVFTERFIRAILDKIFLFAWKFRLKKRS